LRNKHPDPVNAMSDKSEAQAAVDNAITLFCKKASGGIEMLPDKLSSKANENLRNACIKLKSEAEKHIKRGARYARDGECVSKGNLSLSTDTWSELKEIAQSVAEKYSSSPPLRPNSTDIVPNKSNFDVRDVMHTPNAELKVPIKFISGLDVHVHVSQQNGSYSVKQVDLSMSKLVKGGTIEAQAFIDTSNATPQSGGYILIKLSY
jgi:hypothetical protein